MNQADFLAYMVRLTLGGACCFCGILVWARKRELDWMCIAAGAVTNFASFIFDFLVSYGFLIAEDFTAGGVPVLQLLFTCVPLILYAAGFILVLYRKSDPA